MTLTDKLTQMFMKQMLRTPKGRVHFLTQVADAENNDEGKIFEMLKTRTDDEQLQTLVVRHSADEERHARILLERADAQGLPRPEVPEELKLLHALDKALGGFFTKAIETNEDVMRMYLLLQVIEERAISQFSLFRGVLAEVDPKSADVFETIEADEARHLKYCHAIARRYAPTPELHDSTLAHFRTVEAKVFAQNSNRNLFHALKIGLLDVGFFTKALWYIVGAVATLIDPSKPTAFATERLTPQLAAA